MGSSMSICCTNKNDTIDSPKPLRVHFDFSNLKEEKQKWTPKKPYSEIDASSSVSV